eukprot:gene10106-11186_t
MTSKQDSSKRKAEENSKNQPNQKSARKADPSSIFQQETEEVTEWKANGSTTTTTSYILRHVKGETCCASPWFGKAKWPKLLLPISAEDEDDYAKFSIIGAVWKKSSGDLVAVWGADLDDGHVDFFCLDEVAEELEDLSSLLCVEICPPLIDVFDDGSGDSRTPIEVSPSLLRANAQISNLYKGELGEIVGEADDDDDDDEEEYDGEEDEDNEEEEGEV